MHSCYRCIVRCLNVGCGDHIAPGRLNVDIAFAPGIDVRADVRRGLPLACGIIDCGALEQRHVIDARSAVALSERLALVPLHCRAIRRDSYSLNRASSPP